MSNWLDLFKQFFTENEKTNSVMVSFVNRYIEPMNDIKYKIVYDGNTLEGVTTSAKNSIEVLTKSLNPILVHVWARNNNDYKLIDKIIPQEGKPQLVYEHMKSFMHTSKTETHPATAKKEAATVKAPVKPAPGESPTENQGVNPVITKNAESAPVHQPDRPLPDKITKIQLKKIFPAAEDDYLQKVADELNKDLVKYGLDTPLRRAHFFAQVREEAGVALVANEENMNHNVESLKMFKYYRLDPVEAKKDGRIDAPKVKGKKVKPLQAANLQAIANKAYAKRFENGDIDSGDGWRYRGRGFIQLTFKFGYKSFNTDYSKYWSETNPDFLKNPEKIKDFPYNIRSAVWFWLSKNLNKKADEGSKPKDVDGITEVINKYTDSYGHRRANFLIAYAAFK